MPRLTLFRLSVLFLGAGVAGCDATPPPVGMARGAELFETCQPCHGEAGAGDADIAAPVIAGLPQWYIESQLQSFQAGWRGKHAEDLPGLRMRPMAITLTREGDIPSVAQYIASLPALAFPESSLDGNAGAGAERYSALCATCHGEDGLGNEQLHAPPIVQIHDWYLMAQMRNFGIGARGTHPDDTWGLTMRANTVTMNNQAMEDVIAYVQTLR